MSLRPLIGSAPSLVVGHQGEASSTQQHPFFDPPFRTGSTATTHGWLCTPGGGGVPHPEVSRELAAHGGRQSCY